MDQEAQLWERGLDSQLIDCPMIVRVTPVHNRHQASNGNAKRLTQLA